ncbi:MAG: hypothetical protein U0325_22810 [Polyangiales bacterium]
MLNTHRLTLLASAAAIGLALFIARAALRGGGPAVAPNTCEATWSASLGTQPDASPRALVAVGDLVWAAVSQGAEVQLVRVRNGRRHTEVIRAPLAAGAAVRGWFTDAQGPHLAIAEGDRVRVLTPGGPERVVPLAEAPAPQEDTRAIGRAIAGADVLATAAPALQGGRVALWTTRDGAVTTLRYRVLDAQGRAVAPAGTLGELLASADAARASDIAAAPAGPREAVMALATSHGPRIFQLRCGAPR